MIFIIPVIAFLVYLGAAFPALPAYRDAGEFVTDCFTLGVAHPPGYPLYVLAGRVAGLVLPWGNFAYRLNVFSAVTAAVSLGLFSGIVRRLIKPNKLVEMVAFVPAFSYLFWYLSIIPEPYILNIFFVLAAVYFVLGDDSRQALSFFVFGLGLGNRLDLIWIFPVIFFAAFGRNKIRRYTLGLPLLLLGLSIYLYLPLRAMTNPLFNWNDPADINRFIATVTRRSYGHSLDLIAAGYAAGQNFLEGIVFYARQIMLAIGYLGIIPLVVGCAGLWRNNRKFFLLLSASFLLACPLFIYLGNMPPNPHAFKILEDSFLLGNVVLFLLLGIGFVRLGNIRLTETALLLFLIVGFNLLENGKNNFHRFNFSAPDYGKNILRSCPPDTLLVQKKDIQLFSIWWLQNVQRNRPDIVSVAEGLSGSPWYWKMLARRYPGLRLFRLSSPGGLENFIRQNPGQRVALSVDSEIPPPEKLSITERGLVRSVGQENYFPFEEFYIWRQRPRDFFSQNLFTDYGRAYQNRGSRRLSQKKYSLARDDFIAAYAFDDDLAIALSWRAYAYLAENNFAAAWRNYQFCAKNYQRIIKLAYTYKAFPDVIDSFENELLGVYINLGVVAERLGRLEEARWAYQAGLAIRPSAQLYFNQAVLYWKENNFPLVEENLRRALELDPNYPQARFYYQLVRQKLQPVR